MNCRICEQELRDPTPANPDNHHLERSPVDQDLCLSCWFASIEIQKFIIRATSGRARMMWGLLIQDAMKELLAKFR